MNEAVSKIIRNIKQLNPLMYMASGVEDFVKIWAEYKYDAIAKTKYFQKLQSLEKKEKLVVVAIMFALNSYLKINMTENTPWNLFWKGILTDFFPEMGKRLINGDSSPDSEEQEVIELIRRPDNDGNSHYALKEKPKNTGPGFFTGSSDVLRNRLKNYINNGGKGNA